MTESSNPTITYRETVSSSEVGPLIDFLIAKTDLSKRKLKDGIAKGAAWLKRGKGESRRIHRTNYVLRPNDIVEFYYDEKVLKQDFGQAWCVLDLTQYSVWYIPAGFELDGNQFSNHNTINYYLDRHYKSSRQNHVVNRPDSNIAGLILVAHSNSAESKLSLLYARHKVLEEFRVNVVGNLCEKQSSGAIDADIAGNKATTEYECISYNPDTNLSSLLVKKKSQAKGQLLEHFSSIGYPVYEEDHAESAIPQILLTRIAFDCPILNKEVDFCLDEKHFIF